MPNAALSHAAPATVRRSRSSRAFGRVAMPARIHLIGLGLLGALALFVIAAAAAVVRGGPLDPPGAPAPTGPLQAVLQPSPGRTIQVATNLVIHQNGRCGQPCVLGAQGGPHFVSLQASTATPTPTPTLTPTWAPTTMPTDTMTPTGGGLPNISPFAVVDVADCKRLDAFVEAVLVSPQPAGGAAFIEARFGASSNSTSGFGLVGVWPSYVSGVSQPLPSLPASPFLSATPTRVAGRLNFGDGQAIR